jgi:short-subunit dehydrogenase
MALPPPSDSSTALVTGASSGIGEQFAHGLARRGHGVTLVARRADPLERVAGELEREHGVRADYVTADLADPEARDALAAEVERRGRTVEVLVNCAGFGYYGPWVETGRDKELHQLRVLVEAVVDLTGRYLPGMVERGRGAVVSVSSTSGLQPLPHSAGYSAAKAYVDFWNDAVHDELRGTGVTMTAVLPGPVHTGFQDAAENHYFTDRMPDFTFVSPERVAEDGLGAAERGRRSVIPGGPHVRASFRPNRFAPRRLQLAVGGLLTRRPKDS